jgi:hypothetical protein
MQAVLAREGMDTILASSRARLSKYHATQAEKAHPIYVVDQYDPIEKPIPIEQCTRIFQMYEETRRIERLYASSEDVQRATKIISEKKL